MAPLVGANQFLPVAQHLLKHPLEVADLPVLANARHTANPEGNVRHLRSGTQPNFVYLFPLGKNLSLLPDTFRQHAKSRLRMKLPLP